MEMGGPSIVGILALIVGAAAPWWVVVIVGFIAGGTTRFLPGNDGFWLGGVLGFFVGIGSFTVWVLLLDAYYWDRGGHLSSFFVPWIGTIVLGSVSVSLICLGLNHRAKRKQKA